MEVFVRQRIYLHRFLKIIPESFVLNNRNHKTQGKLLIGLGWSEGANSIK